jgi:hypothetical protein
MQDNDDLFKTLCNNCKEPPQKCRRSGQTSVLLMKKVNTKSAAKKTRKKYRLQISPFSVLLEYSFNNIPSGLRRQGREMIPLLVPYYYDVTLL